VLGHSSQVIAHTSRVESLIPVLIPGAGLYTRPTLIYTKLKASSRADNCVALLFWFVCFENKTTQVVPKEEELQGQTTKELDTSRKHPKFMPFGWRNGIQLVYSSREARFDMPFGWRNGIRLVYSSREATRHLGDGMWFDWFIAHVKQGWTWIGPSSILVPIS